MYGWNCLTTCRSTNQPDACKPSAPVQLSDADTPRAHRLTADAMVCSAVAMLLPAASSQIRSQVATCMLHQPAGRQSALSEAKLSCSVASNCSQLRRLFPDLFSSPRHWIKFRVHLYHDTFVTIRLLICRTWVFLEDTMNRGSNYTSCFRRCLGIPSCTSMQHNLSDRRHQQHTQRPAQTTQLRGHHRRHRLTAVASDGATSSAPPPFSGPKVC